MATRAKDGARETRVAWRSARIQDRVLGSADTHRSSCEHARTRTTRTRYDSHHVTSADLVLVVRPAPVTCGNNRNA